MDKFACTIKKINGLRVLLLPRQETQAVSVLTLIGVGSRYESPAQNGLSHFLEHMFFKGTQTRPTTKEIAEAVDNVGGEFNAFTGEEYTGYYVKAAGNHLETAGDVVADILLRPLFPDEEIEREKGVIVEEIRMYTDQPMRHIHHLWQEAQFGDHPLGRRIDGTEERVRSFGRKDFVNYTKKHYHRENAVVVVVGNFSEKEGEQLVKKLFADLPSGKETKPKAAPKKGPVTRFLHEKRAQLDQTHMMVGVPGVSSSDPDRFAADILATILGGGMSSRLFISVRERNGLAYMVRTMSDEATDTGSFVTQAGVRTDEAHKALELILQEYDAVMNDGVTAEELAKAKEMLRGKLVLQLEETNSIALFAGMQELLDGKIMTPVEIWKSVNAVTTQDVQAVAKRLLDPKRRAMALLSPHSSTKRFEKLLNI